MVDPELVKESKEKDICLYKMPVEGDDGKTSVHMILTIGEEQFGWGKDFKGRTTYGHKAPRAITFPEKIMPNLVKFFSE